MTDAGSDARCIPRLTDNEVREIRDIMGDDPHNSIVILQVDTGTIQWPILRVCSELLALRSSSELIPSCIDRKPPVGPAAQAFLSWWRDDAERKKCFLDQALGSYCSGFPGRVLPLLVELLEGK